MGRRILIIDDDNHILEILEIIFAAEGYSVILSNTGEAVEQLATIQPDLILLDVRIIGHPKSGDEICAELKSNHLYDKLPVILISAESDLEVLANECSADAFIRKPFDMYELIGRVKDFID